MDEPGLIEALILSLSLPMQCLVVFCMMYLLDAVFALYTRRTSTGRWFQAGILAGMIAFTGSITVISYSTNNFLVIPLILGAMAGTMTVVWWDSKHKTTAVELSQKEILTLRALLNGKRSI